MTDFVKPKEPQVVIFPAVELVAAVRFDVAVLLLFRKFVVQLDEQYLLATVLTKRLYQT